ncbi:MAG: hypothetical protein ACYCUM_10965 [Solirubrobacteraceae bacterium]
MMLERHDLLDVLSDAMRGVAHEELLGGTLRAGRVKSRLLEAHPAEASGDGVEHLLGQLAADASLSARPVGDDLWALVGSKDAFFVDTLNPRFWLLHSTAPAEQLRGLLKRHLLTNARVDQAWFSSDHLAELEGERRWVRSSFSSDMLQPNESGAVVPRRWRIQVEGENPDDLLALVAKEERYRAGAALTAVSSRLREPGVGAAEVAADYQGGFVASGNDFHLVAGMLWRTLDRYEYYVHALEERYRLGVTATEEGALEIDGEVATIEFSHEVEDLPALVANLFTCREPFRLWAVPREVANNQWEANAVDLHVGHPVRLEITPLWLRMLLGPDTCGNTLARLVANLQHRFDARTRLPLPSAA